MDKIDRLMSVDKKTFNKIAKKLIWGIPQYLYTDESGNQFVWPIPYYNQSNKYSAITGCLAVRNGNPGFATLTGGPTPRFAQTDEKGRPMTYWGGSGTESDSAWSTASHQTQNREIDPHLGEPSGLGISAIKSILD